MAKYLFITYGEPGWRGVQIRALRMAKYLPKDEVLFWNSDDSQIIKEWGFAVETIESGLINPKSIKFPQGVEAVIFSDLPSNKLFNYSIYQAALKQNIKIVICEQLYRRNQMQEGVYRKFAKNCDLILLNSLSFFQGEQRDNIKIIPPQIEFDFNQNTKNEIYKKYGIPPQTLLIFGIGYHEKVYEKIREITQRLTVRNKNFYTIVPSPTVKSIQRDNQLITVPFDVGDDFFKLLYSADLVMVKFGFLQILEALALHKPTIVLGEAGLVLKNPKVLDEIFQSTLRLDLEITENTLNFINKFISDSTFREYKISEVKKLHDGKLWGAKMAVEEIKKILANSKSAKKQISKKVAILINNEIIDKNEWLKKQDDIYPLCFIIPAESEKTDKERVPQELLEKQIKNLIVDRGDELLTHSFKNLYIFSDRKYDGFIDIIPWYDTFVKNIEDLLKNADEIYLSPFSLKLFGSLIKNVKIDNKIKNYP